MQSLNIPKNYLNLTLDELLNNVLGSENLVVLSSSETYVEGIDSYKDAIKSFNAFMPAEYTLRWVSGSDEDETEWTIVLSCMDADEEEEFNVSPEEKIIDDRAIINAINRLLNKVGTTFRVFSYWDSEWDGDTIGFGIISEKLIPELKNILKIREENDWHEVFSI